ncbi:porin outer membrane protein [Rhizobium phaseoli Brasil 5]|nr:porin outer membrane protein [Rhizobium phaseoli Brasil 5]
MNIRMVLLASAAAFAASTPVLAADAIVAAEPEPVEYVRVCDAYGTGYFYIPGTETCLKIEGYIRFQVDVGDQPLNLSASNDSDWDAKTRGQVQFTAKSDTEYGPLTGVIVMQFNADNATEQNAILDSAYLDVAGFRAGLFYSWWGDGLSGETDDIGSIVTLHNSLRYQYESGTFYAGISVDELEDGFYKSGEGPNNVGVAFGAALPARSATRSPAAGTSTTKTALSVQWVRLKSVPVRSASLPYTLPARTRTTPQLNGLSLPNTLSRQPTSSRSLLASSTTATTTLPATTSAMMTLGRLV